MGDTMVIATMAGHLVRRLQQTAVQVFQARARAEGVDLTPVQFAALDAIRANPGIDQAGIAARIAYDRATIGGVVDRLQQKGLIARRVSGRDRRAREIELTAQGAALYDRFLPVVRDLQDEILQELTADERRVFLALARKALRDPAAGAGHA